MVASVCLATQTQKWQQPALLFVKHMWDFWRWYTGFVPSHSLGHSRGRLMKQQCWGEGRGEQRTWECKSWFWVTVNRSDMHKILNSNHSNLENTHEVKTPRDPPGAWLLLSISWVQPSSTPAAKLEKRQKIQKPQVNQRSLKTLHKPQTCPFPYYTIQCRNSHVKKKKNQPHKDQYTQVLFVLWGQKEHSSLAHVVEDKLHREIDL